MFRSIAALSLLSVFSMSGWAQNTGGVFGPGVKEGHRSFQYRATMEPDDANDEVGFAQRLHYQQSIDSDLMWRVLAQTRKTADSDTDFDFFQAELFWQLHDGEDYQSGVRFDARVRDGERPDQIGFNWMHEYALNSEWRARLLLLTAVQFGTNKADGVILQTRGNIWKKTSYGSVGVEMFNSYGTTDDIADFDDQGHTIGPFISKAVGSEGWSIFAGALTGLTDASPDLELRFWLTKAI